MLLTKKSIWKIVITAVCYAVLGTVCMVLWFVFNRIGVNEHFKGKHNDKVALLDSF